MKTVQLKTTDIDVKFYNTLSYFDSEVKCVKLRDNPEMYRKIMRFSSLVSNEECHSNNFLNVANFFRATNWCPYIYLWTRCSRFISSKVGGRLKYEWQKLIIEASEELLGHKI